MGEIVTQDVVTSATIEDVQFYVKFAQVDRHIGPQPAHAKVKGIAEDPSALEQNQRVDVSVNDTPIFSGELKRAVQNEEGVITIEAYDSLFSLKNKLVTLNTERPRFASEVARDIFEKAGVTLIDRFGSPEDGDPGDAYVAPARNYPGGDNLAPRELGSGKLGEPIEKALRRLANKIGGVLWVDGRDVIRFEPYPNHNKYTLKYVTEVNSGKNTTNFEQVLVKGGTPMIEGGPAVAHVYSEVSVTSQSNFDTAEGETSAAQEGTFVVEDKNVATQNEADTLAVSEMVNQAKRAEAGTVTVAGNADVGLWDFAEVASLRDEDFPSGGVPPGSFRQTLMENTFVVRGITHKLNSSDGFLTTLELAPDIKSVAESLTGPASGLANLFAAKIDDNQDTQGLLDVAKGFTQATGAI